MSATEGDGAEEQDEEMVEAQPSTAPKEEEEEQSMIREAAIGKGRLLLWSECSTACSSDASLTWYASCCSSTLPAAVLKLLLTRLSRQSFDWPCVSVLGSMNYAGLVQS